MLTYDVMTVYDVNAEVGWFICQITFYNEMRDYITLTQKKYNKIDNTQTNHMNMKRLNAVLRYTKESGIKRVSDAV